MRGGPVTWLSKRVLSAMACAAAISAMLPVALPAYAADTVFTVGNYPVQARDKNAVAAKDQALAEGQQAAFRSLLKRLVPVTAYNQLKRVEGVKAAGLVSGVSVRSERNSSTEYLASLDFAFQADAVRRTLGEQGIAFVEDQAPEIVIVVVSRDAEGSPIKADTNVWAEAWKRLDLDHTLTPGRLEPLRATVGGSTIDLLLKGDDAALGLLAKEYRTEKVLVAVAERDTPAKKVTVTLAGQDATGPILWKKVYRIEDGDYAYTAELGAVVALGVLEGRWKVLKTAGSQVALADTGAPRPVPGEQLRLTAEFTNLDEWNTIRRQLLDTPGVENLDIAVVSARSADMTMTYPGGAPALASLLGGRGLKMSSSAQGWVVTPEF